MALPLEVRAGLLLLALALGGLGLFLFERRLKQEGAAECVAEAQQARADAITAARETEQRWSLTQNEVANEAERIAARSRAAAADLRAAAPGLRGAVAQACGIPDDSPAAAGGPAAAGPELVLADVLGEAEERLRALAELADERGIAGQACERSYDALTQ